jgi:hypothetical protein
MHIQSRAGRALAQPIAVSSRDLFSGTRKVYRDTKCTEIHDESKHDWTKCRSSCNVYIFFPKVYLLDFSKIHNKDSPSDMDSQSYKLAKANS